MVSHLKPQEVSNLFLFLQFLSFKRASKLLVAGRFLLSFHSLMPKSLHLQPCEQKKEEKHFPLAKMDYSNVVKLN